MAQTLTGMNPNIFLFSASVDLIEDFCIQFIRY